MKPDLKELLNEIAAAIDAVTEWKQIRTDDIDGEIEFWSGQGGEWLFKVAWASDSRGHADGAAMKSGLLVRLTPDFAEHVRVRILASQTTP